MSSICKPYNQFDSDPTNCDSKYLGHGSNDDDDDDDISSVYARCMLANEHPGCQDSCVQGDCAKASQCSGYQPRGDCNPSPHPSPKQTWSQSDMTILQQFTQKLNVNNTQSQCLMDNISKNYSSMNGFVNAAKNKDINILNIFNKCGVKGPNNGPNNSLNNILNNISNNTCTDCTSHQTCDSSNKCVCNSWWTGDDCDKLSGLSIGLIVGGVLLILIIIAIIIWYRYYKK